MKRSGAIAAVTALGCLLAALLAPAAGAAEPLFLEPFEAANAAEKLASESTLRLTDMPAGFVVSTYESTCGGLRDERETEGIYEEREHPAPNPSEAFLTRTKAAFCEAEYERLYRAPGTGSTPASLASFALVTPSAKAAAEGLALSAETFEYQLGVGDFKAVGTAPPLGEEARLFHSNHSRFRGLSNLPATLLLWRQGPVIGGIFTNGIHEATNDAAAAAYAARQQAYIAAPRPYLAGEAEDMLTYLGNPNIKVPIWWLGPTFEPQGLRPTFFEGAYGREELARRLPGRELSVDYFNYLRLDTWTRQGWAKFSRTTLGRRQWSWHCSRSQTVKLPHGHAVIYAAYRKDEATCPSRPPNHFSAHVFLPGIVIAIGEPLGLYEQGDGTGDYESWRGLKAVVQSLRRWRPGEAE
jgi:hypothetical protein